MPDHRIRRADWKVFREPRVTALERFCQRVLDEVERARSNETRSFHERYGDIYEWIHDRDDQILRPGK